MTASTETGTGTEGGHTARTDDAESVDAALEMGAILAGSPASDIYAFGVCALEVRPERTELFTLGSSRLLTLSLSYTMCCSLQMQLPFSCLMSVEVCHLVY